MDFSGTALGAGVLSLQGSTALPGALPLDGDPFWEGFSSLVALTGWGGGFGRGGSMEHGGFDLTETSLWGGF